MSCLFENLAWINYTGYAKQQYSSMLHFIPSPGCVRTSSALSSLVRSEDGFLRLSEY